MGSFTVTGTRLPQNFVLREPLRGYIVARSPGLPLSYVEVKLRRGEVSFVNLGFTLVRC